MELWSDDNGLVGGISFLVILGLVLAEVGSGHRNQWHKYGIDSSESNTGAAGTQVVGKGAAFTVLVLGPAMFSSTLATLMKMKP